MRRRREEEDREESEERRVGGTCRDRAESKDVREQHLGIFSYKPRQEDYDLSTVDGKDNGYPHYGVTRRSLPEASCRVQTRT